MTLALAPDPAGVREQNMVRCTVRSTRVRIAACSATTSGPRQARLAGLGLTEFRARDPAGMLDSCFRAQDSAGMLDS